MYHITIEKKDIAGEIEASYFVKCPLDMEINEWVDIFRSILCWMTFHPETIQEIFKED